MSEPTKITGVHIKLKSIDLIDELLNKAASDEYEIDEATLELARMIKRRIIQDFFSDAFIPRAKVQAAVDRIRDCSGVLRREGYEPVGHDNALMHIANHTGVTPTEVRG